MSRQELRDLAAFREMAEAHIERLGAAIMARRKAMGWSRARLGREANAHEKTVERWEKAQTAGALDNIETIAKALDMDRDDLLALAIPRPESKTPDVLGELGGTATERLARLEQQQRQALEKLDDILDYISGLESVRDAVAADQESAPAEPPGEQRRVSNGTQGKAH